MGETMDPKERKEKGRRLEREQELEFAKIEVRRKTENETKIREASHEEDMEARFKVEEDTRLKAEEDTRLKAEEDTRLKPEEDTRLTRLRRILDSQG
ncbi:hypothetical protein TNCV_4379281 [Trichonephila clavipes]|nr:hypothetical protein TNCV_4379281 [Trichonephila clavipes]